MGPRSQEGGKAGEGGGGGELYLTPHSHHQNDIALRWAAMRAIIKSLIIVVGKVTQDKSP